MSARRLTVIFLLLVPAVAGLRAPIADPDLPWHLAAGEWILAHGRVPWVDPFSCTVNGQPWIAYSWLVEVLFVGARDAFGFGSLVFVKTAALVVMVGATFLACRAAGARTTVAVSITALAMVGCVGGWSVRPQVISLAFLAIVSWLVRSERARPALPIVVPLLVALWANVHILFVVGLGVMGLAAAGARIDRRADRRLDLAFLLGCGATLLTPYGIDLLALLPVMAAQPSIAPWVSEFLSPSFKTKTGSAIGATIVGAVMLLSWVRTRPTAYEAATLVLPLAGALAMARNAAIFAILAAPTLARLLERELPPEEPEADLTLVRGRVHGALALVATGILGLSIPYGSSGQQALEPDLYPAQASATLAGRQGCVLTTFDWGGFVIQERGPDWKVAIDGRTQVYGKRLLRLYARTHYGKPGWERLLDEVQPTAILWRTDGHLTQLLRLHPDWELTYADELAVIFEPSSSRGSPRRRSVDATVPAGSSSTP